VIPSEPDPRWEAFAAAEPYFAVVAAPEYLRRNLTPERRDAFFASGQAQVDAMFRAIELQLSPYFEPTAILEYGCGIGRLAIPLARRAARSGGTVVAVDRSPAMLAAAREQARRQGATNIEFCTPHELGDRTFDFITCYFVLQRLAPHHGLSLMADLTRRLSARGVALFHVPYRSTAPAWVETVRWLRRRVPGVNAVVNAARGRRPAHPFSPNFTYDLAAVFRTLKEQSIETMHVVFEPHEGLDTALLYMEKPAPKASDGAGGDEDAPIEVADLIARSSIDDLNRAAEDYFASLTNVEHHLTKPFSQPHEAPSLLLDIAVLMQGLRLTAGQRVLDFGAGTGWLARFLTQLGCQVVLLDVSPSALELARELYERLPIIGERPAPEFLIFDGRRIDLPDSSVDRIVSFHAFHHAPHPAAILAELARVLAPGGIAGFAEPGPRHSRSPVSQFEMRNYGVIENDVDVHDIWRAARSHGFSELQLAVFHGPPFHVSLQDFEDLLAGGPTTARWSTATRVFLRNARTFFLTKGGAVQTDSRSAEGLKCHIHATLAGAAGEGDPIAIDAIVTNTGAATWLPLNARHGGVGCGAHLYTAGGELVQFDLPVQPLTSPPRDIAPGETVHCRVLLPPQPPGSYIAELDCVAARVSWFAPLGSRPPRLPFEIRRSK
jgi:SAM-dependent methyltransferase